jgi:hypothetical protein
MHLLTLEGMSELEAHLFAIQLASKEKSRTGRLEMAIRGA